jgi:hypothetical protein
MDGLVIQRLDNFDFGREADSLWGIKAKQIPFGNDNKKKQRQQE